MVENQIRTLVNFIENISSKKAIQFLAFLEFIFYGYIFYLRVELIKAILSLPKGLRELINLIDYENGWNLIFLLLLMSSCIFPFKLGKVKWLIKQTCLLTICITLGFNIQFVAIIAPMLIAYFSLNKVSLHFGIYKSEKIKYHTISICGMIIFLPVCFLINILNY